MTVVTAFEPVPKQPWRHDKPETGSKEAHDISHDVQRLPRGPQCGLAKSVRKMVAGFLRRISFGRLASSNSNQPYIVPVDFAGSPLWVYHMTHERCYLDRTASSSGDSAIGSSVRPICVSTQRIAKPRIQSPGARSGGACIYLAHVITSDSY